MESQSRARRPRSRLVLLVGVMLAVTVLFPATASAHSGTTVTPFKVTYSGVEVAPGQLLDVSCAGINVVTTGRHAINEDIEVCTWSGDRTGFVPGFYHSDPGSPVGNFPPFGPTALWFSDDGVNGIANSWAALVSFDRNGTLTIASVSTYPN